MKRPRYQRNILLILGVLVAVWGVVALFLQISKRQPSPQTQKVETDFGTHEFGFEKGKEEKIPMH